MNIVVRSRSEAKAFTSDVPWAAISISDRPDEFPKLNACQRVGLLQLCFHDVDDVSHWEQSPAYDAEVEPVLFTYQMAQQVWCFVEQHRGKIETLLVHCFAGRSRSPAIAAAIAECLLRDTERTHFRGKCPNMRVYSKLLLCWENWQLKAIEGCHQEVACTCPSDILAMGPGCPVHDHGACHCDWQHDQHADGAWTITRTRQWESCPIHKQLVTVTEDDGTPE